MPRQQTHEIVIDAPIEAVWKAISDGEELTRWFVGGGDGRARRRRHDLHFVGRRRKKARARSKHGSRTGSCGRSWRRSTWARRSHDPAVPMIDEYTIERRDGKTVLRLVSSGIPDAPEWDGFYNGTNSGWNSFFRTLRHYLEHHRGKPRTTIKVIGKLTGSLEEAWARLLAGVRAARHASSSSRRRRCSRRCIPETRRRLPRAHDVRRRRTSSSTRMLSVYGKTPAEVEAIRAEWQPWLEHGPRRRDTQPCLKRPGLQSVDRVLVWTRHTMAVTDSFVEFVLEQLDALGPITSKRMFGGVGLYAATCFLRSSPATCST